MPPAARYLLDPPLPGPHNMARDEALLQNCVEPAAPLTLRFYAWSPATISLGYFQDHAEFLAQPEPIRSLSLVRRTTGGGAILHDWEITYSLVVPLAHPLVAGRPNDLYRVAHEAVIDAIGGGTRFMGTDPHACDSSAQRGPFFCFARRHGLDVVVPDPRDPTGYSKIAGSAQRRTSCAILQHGSIMLDSRYAQQPTATWSALAGRPITFAEAAEKLRETFARRLGATLVDSSWRDEELIAAEPYLARYGGEPWTLNRER